MCLLDFFRFSSFYIFFKQKTAYEMRISDWSSDVCSSDLDGDELTKRLQELEIDLRDVSKSDPSGFKLSAEQLDRLRQIRGHEATDENGSTLREALQDTLDDPWFKGLKTKNAKQSAVAEIISGFNKEAKARSEERRVGKEGVHTCRVGGTTV